VEPSTGVAVTVAVAGGSQVSAETGWGPSTTEPLAGVDPDGVGPAVVFDELVPPDELHAPTSATVASTAAAATTRGPRVRRRRSRLRSADPARSIDRFMDDPPRWRAGLRKFNDR
jgi:hypothetical protein